MPGPDTGAGTAQNTYPEPYTLAGTKITGVTTPLLALSARVHRQAIRQENTAELWYLDRYSAAWALFPAQPVMSDTTPIQIVRQYRQPATLACAFIDHAGLLIPEARSSPYNLNAGGQYDPLLDEARKVLLRAGSFCWRSVADGVAPTSTLAPSAGTLAMLTDGTLGQISSSTSSYAQFAPASAAPFAITLDLGSSLRLRHFVARFGTKKGTASLPASIALSVSGDGVTYIAQGTRPVGGDGGDWQEDLVGKTVEMAFCDLDATARYVKLTVTPVGAQTIAMDEVAVYAEGGGAVLGRNVFVGYLGDEIDLTPQGLHRFRATDSLKKLSDNNDVRVTAAYRNLDIADILYDLLTNSGYWGGAGAAYDAPFQSGEVGWTTGTAYTGFKMPAWQGTGNNMLAYVYELIHEIGWHLYVDGNGILQLSEPTYKQRTPDRVFAVWDGASRGNSDARNLVRKRAGKDLRNYIRVASGDLKTGAANSVVFDPASVSRYGRRTTIITDPIATSPQLRQKIGQYVLRDYAYRLQTLSADISPDADTVIRGLYAFKATGRPSLASRVSVGGGRAREYWSLESIEHSIRVGEWKGACELIPMFPAGPQTPSLLSITGGNGTLALTFSAITDATAVSTNWYVSTTGPKSGFTLRDTNVALTSPHTISGLTNGTTYWVYMTAVDDIGAESFASNILSGTPSAGGSATINPQYSVSDLSVAFVPATFQGFAMSNQYGPNAWSYEFALSFTSPGPSPDDFVSGLYNFTVGYVIGGTAPGSTDPQLTWNYQSEWDSGGVRVPPGKQFDRTTNGKCVYYARIKTTAAIGSGTPVWFRLFTKRDRLFMPAPYASNTASANAP